MSLALINPYSPRKLRQILPSPSLKFNSSYSAAYLLAQLFESPGNAMESADTWVRSLPSALAKTMASILSLNSKHAATKALSDTVSATLAAKSPRSMKCVGFLALPRLDTE